MNKAIDAFSGIFSGPSGQLTIKTKKIVGRPTYSIQVNGFIGMTNAELVNTARQHGCKIRVRKPDGTVCTLKSPGDEPTGAFMAALLTEIDEQNKIITSATK